MRIRSRNLVQPFRFVKIPGTKGSLTLNTSGQRLYALESNGLSVYNIEDPKHPKKLGHVGDMGMSGNCGSKTRQPS